MIFEVFIENYIFVELFHVLYMILKMENFFMFHIL